MSATQRNPWNWIPTLYFGQGIPYVVVMSLAVVLYKNLGMSNSDIALYTSWLYLPWVIKPLWSPLVDVLKTKRFWIVALQAVVAVLFAGVALTLPTDRWVQLSLAMLWLMAFASATHDIAADGFYMMGLKQHEQAAFVGIRSTFYRLANIAGQGVLVWLAGELKDMTGDVKLAWMLVFGVLAGLFVLLAAVHSLSLPRPLEDVAVPRTASSLMHEFFDTFRSFFARNDIVVVLAFLLLFRLGESQALKLVVPFLLDKSVDGGLGLTNQQVGLVYGTLGIAALTLGGILGGLTISRCGLKRCIWPMLAAVHIPNVLYVWLAYAQPVGLTSVSFALIVEQFGYGFGFAAYLLVMIMVADGPHKTAHYALCTGFMAAGMMLPGMVSGAIQDALGYPHFFIYVCICTLPSLVATWFLKIPPEFGMKPKETPPQEAL